MSKKDNIKYDIDKFVIVNYVDAINSIEESMTQIKKILKGLLYHLNEEKKVPIPKIVNEHNMKYIKVTK